MKLLIFFGSIFVSLIPERYRTWWPRHSGPELRAATITSGALEAMIAIPGTLSYIAAPLYSARGGDAIGFLSAFFDLGRLFSVYMFVEGLVRCLAAMASDQTLPMLILQIPVWIHGAMDRKGDARSLGSLIVDKVEKATSKPYDVCIWSCRSKPHWNSYMTVRFEGEFYQLVNAERIPAGAQQFIFYLRRHPVGRPVVVVYEYRPEDVLKPATDPQRWTPETMVHGDRS